MKIKDLMFCSLITLIFMYLLYELRFVLLIGLTIKTMKEVTIPMMKA